MLRALRLGWVRQVINVRAFDLDKTLAMDDGFLDIDSEHMHDSSISSFGVHIEVNLSRAS